jgi:hypothetical protein
VIGSHAVRHPFLSSSSAPDLGKRKIHSVFCVDNCSNSGAAGFAISTGNKFVLIIRQMHWKRYSGPQQKFGESLHPLKQLLYLYNRRIGSNPKCQVPTNERTLATPKTLALYRQTTYSRIQKNMACMILDMVRQCQLLQDRKCSLNHTENAFLRWPNRIAWMTERNHRRAFYSTKWSSNTTNLTSKQYLHNAIVSNIHLRLGFGWNSPAIPITKMRITGAVENRNVFRTDRLNPHAMTHHAIATDPFDEYSLERHEGFDTIRSVRNRADYDDYLTASYAGSQWEALHPSKPSQDVWRSCRTWPD